MKKLTLSLTALLLALWPAFAGAETPAFVPLNPAAVNKKLDAAATKLNSGKAGKEEIAAILQEVAGIEDDRQQTRQQYAEGLASVQKKLNALGPAPEKDESEPAAIAKQRKEFAGKADGYKAQIAQMDLLAARIDEINGLILKIRNRRLLDNILVKQSSIFHPEEFWQSLTTFAGFVFELVKSPFSWYRGLPPEKEAAVNNNILTVIGVMAGALVAAFFLSRYIRSRLGYRAAVEHPDYSQKVRAGIAMFIVRGVIPAAVIGAFLFWLKGNGVVNTGSFGLLLHTAAVYLLYYYLTKAAVRTVFTPDNGKWRIIEVADGCAKCISSALVFSAAAVCTVSFLQSLAGRMDYDSSIVYSLKIFANAVKAFCVVLVARKALYNNNPPVPGEIDDDTPLDGLSTASKISLFITFLMTAAFAVSLFGYIRLSEYVINRFIISVVAIGVFYIIDKLIRGLFHRILQFRFWLATFRLGHKTLRKAEFWFGLLLSPVMWAFAVLVLLAVWGVSVDLLLARIKGFLTGFNIGGIHISITSIILGIVCFFVLLSLFGLLKNSFVRGNLSKIDMDNGVRNSLVSSINFLGFIVSALIAVAVMGGSLSSITIIAGALSFGVGLGLQNMVGNLAAGMTILWERPIKIGDWVVIGGQEGLVRKINMRSTEIETWDKSTVIVPNSAILSQSLTNYTYSGLTGRVVIKVGVGYDSDIELTKRTLLEIAASNPDVLTSPEPSVAFNNLGDSSLEFQLNCFTANVFKRSGIANDLREKIINRFRELKIDIPYPQRTVYLERPAAGTNAPKDASPFAERS